MQHVAPAVQFDLGTFEKVIALNLTAGFHLSQLTLTSMISKGFGRIIFVASAHGKVASCKSAYVASKHGVVGLTKTIALETAREKMSLAILYVLAGYLRRLSKSKSGREWPRLVILSMKNQGCSCARSSRPRSLFFLSISVILHYFCALPLPHK